MKRERGDERQDCVMGRVARKGNKKKGRERVRLKCTQASHGSSKVLKSEVRKSSKHDYDGGILAQGNRDAGV
jgi:hypothetical protein